MAWTPLPGSADLFHDPQQHSLLPSPLPCTYWSHQTCSIPHCMLHLGTAPGDLRNHIMHMTSHSQKVSCWLWHHSFNNLQVFCSSLVPLLLWGEGFQVWSSPGLMHSWGQRMVSAENMGIVRWGCPICFPVLSSLHLSTRFGLLLLGKLTAIISSRQNPVMDSHYCASLPLWSLFALKYH